MTSAEFIKAFLLKQYPELKNKDLSFMVEKRVQEAIQKDLAISIEPYSSYQNYQ